MNKAPDFRLSSDSLALAKALESIKINETVEYQKLSSAIGRDVQGVGRSAMQQARKVVQRDHKMVFDVVRGVGLRRLDDDAIVDASDKSISVVRRGIRRAAKRLVCADYEALTKDKKTKHNVAMSVFGVLSEVTGSAGQKRIEARVSAIGGTLTAALAGVVALAAEAAH